MANRTPTLLRVQSSQQSIIIAPVNLTEDIKNRALELGFDLAGVTNASPLETRSVEELQAWIESGFAGDMSYMRRNFEKRINPAALLKNARSVIVVGLNYKAPAPGHKRPKSAGPTGRVAAYAQYEDYHIFIKQRLRELADFIARAAPSPPHLKICVDSAPLAERALAARAGLGFIGRNHMLINPRLGPEILLGEIVTTLKLQPDRPVPDACSACKKCIQACPTGALRADGRLDARKCISYLTIEHKHALAETSAGKIGDRLFGCDECVLACPYQLEAPACRNSRFKFYTDRARLDLNEILSMSPELFEARFADSPIRRPGLENLKRNARICLENPPDEP